MAVGFCGCVLALIIYKFGCDWIDVVLLRLLWSGGGFDRLELSGSAASNAGLLDEKISTSNIIVFGVTLELLYLAPSYLGNSFLLFRF